MRAERVRANLIYLLIALSIGCVYYFAGSDPAYPTGEYKNAIVESVAPNHSKHRPKKTVFIQTEDGVNLVRVVDMSRKFEPGQELQLKEFRSKKRGIIKYEIVR